MPSPFPGMNPYLEQNDSWEEFHLNFISRTQEMLAGAIGPNYLVKIEARLYIHELSAEERKLLGRADVSVSRLPGSSSTATAVVTQAAPYELSLPSVDKERYTWLEIVDRRTRRVVAVVELLSPTNKKPGPDRDEYLSKCAFLLYGSVHFVEIDLRRGGTRPQPPILPACDYYIMVKRKEDWPRAGMWPLSLRDRLPVVPIPLNAPDPEVQLDLQAVLHRVYDAADYGKYIYGEIPDPPLSPEDDAWAKQFVPQTARS
jgi:hypothetical protein